MEFSRVGVTSYGFLWRCFDSILTVYDHSWGCDLKLVHRTLNCLQVLSTAAASEMPNIKLEVVLSKHCRRKNYINKIDSY